MNTAIIAPSCQPLPSPGPLRSGVCYSFGPHAAPWHITVAGLGWIIAAFMVAAWLLGLVQGWFDGQYEVSRTGLRVKVTRRWYGTRAWVARRGHRHEDDHHRYQVVKRDSEGTDCPWLLVQDIDDDGAEVTWEPITRFVPEAVRKLRPWIFRYGRLPLPVLFIYRTLPWPMSGRPPGWPQDGADGSLPGVRGRRLELTRTGAGRWALFRNCVPLAHSTAADMDHTAAREWASAALGSDVEWANATVAPDEKCGYWIAPPPEDGA